MRATHLYPSDRATQSVLLEGITWQTYQAILNDSGKHRASRLAYEQGILEIILPSALHEFLSRLLEAMVRTLTEELHLPLRGYGSTTLERKDLERGVEPDACFYIQSLEQILNRYQLDLSAHSPPDLAIEVDITSSSRRRFGIYLQLQIPEIWRYSETNGVTIYQLQGNQYVECQFSPTFPMVSGTQLNQFLQLAQTQDDNSIIRELRQWLRRQI